MTKRRICGWGTANASWLMGTLLALGAAGVAWEGMIPGASAASGNSAEFVEQSVPSQLAPGESTTVTITWVNTGSTPWTYDSGYKLGTQNPQDNTLWTGATRVYLPRDAVVAPGESVEFSFDITAPAVPGSYSFQWRMVEEEVEWFGEYSPNVVIRVMTPVVTNKARFVSQTVPPKIEPGQSAQVSITYQNTGTSPWTHANGYRLGTQSPQDNVFWLGTNRVNLSATETIRPGENKTFTFTITAPAQSGTYPIQFRMLQESVEWFGDFTPRVLIKVEAAPRVNAAQFVSQSVPSSMAPGSKANVRIKMRNTGTTTWTPADLYRLGSQNPQDNLLWTGNGRVEVPGAVAPSAEATFDFEITAPDGPGTYHFQWRMLEERVEWFGDYTPDVAILVQEPGGPTPTAATPTPTREPPECRPRDDCDPRLSAVIVSDTIPAEMVAGLSYDVAVTVMNTGRNTWTREGGYKLGARDDEDPFYAEGRVWLPEGVEVPQDETYTFQFTMTAPDVPGLRLTDWQMVRENVAWFGQVLTKYVRVVPVPSTPSTPCPTGESCETAVPRPTLFPVQPGLMPGSNEERSSIDLDGDGMSQSFELELAQHFFPTIWYDPGEDCTWPGGSVRRPPSHPGRLVFRVRPHPADSRYIAMTFALLYERDCGDVEGSSAHHGDVEPFAITLAPNPMCPLGYGIVTVQSWAHAGTSGEHVDDLYLYDAPCDFGFSVDPTGRNDVVLASENKHGNYLYLSTCDSGGFLGSDHCGLDFTMGDVNSWVGYNAGEWGARRHRDLAPLGFEGEQVWSNLDFCGGLSRESNCPPPVEDKLRDDFVAGVMTPIPPPPVTPTSTPTPASGNRAQFVSQTAPAELKPGESAEVTVTMINAGETVWDPAAEYYLGSQSPENNRTWGVNRVPPPAPVEPGQQVMFAFTIRAPEVAGNYDFQWRMLRENVEWFGDFTPKVAIQVGTPPVDGARFPGHTIPAGMTAGQSYPVSVTVQNTGTAIWSGGNDGLPDYFLAVRAGLLVPPGTRFPLPADAVIRSGESYTFEFTIDAPFMRSARTELQMLHEGVGYFGDTLAIRVDIDQPPLGERKILLNPVAGPPGTAVSVGLLEGPAFSPREKIRLSFGDPEGHDYSLVPAEFSWIDASRMSFTVPADAACGTHYIAVMAGAREASESASFEVDGACDPSRRRSFDVLSYNIQMLPDEACPPYTPVTDGCHKDYRAGLIITHPDLQGHDAVVFVEAFSDSHRDRIVEGLGTEYPYHGEILGEDHGAVQDGGVIILSKWPIEEEDQDVFANCSGFADCHADKGVNYAKINKGGVPYHVFGTHLDAGGAREDISTRHMQLAEMATFVLARRIPWFEAVLMAGDFNVDRNSSATEYHRMLRILRATPPERVGDATNPSGQWIDYVLYSAVHVLPIESLNEVRYPRDAGGGDLSDHYAVLGRFAYADSAIRSQGGTIGGGGPRRIAGMWRRFAL